MRAAQKAMARFMPLIDWTRFCRRNLSTEGRARGHHLFACGDDRQAVAWLLRARLLADDGCMRRDVPARSTVLTLPMVADRVQVTEWDTVEGRTMRVSEQAVQDGQLRYETTPLVADLAMAVVAAE